MPYSLSGVGHNGFEKADLHIHTKCSDGVFTPEEIVEKAKKTGLKAISITDHDSVLGIDKAKPLAREYGIELINGVEMSSTYQGHDIRKGKPFETQDSKMGWMIAAGTLPIVVFGLLFKTEIETSLRSLYWISAALIVLALMLTLAEWLMKQRAKKGLETKSMQAIGWKEALLIGLFQSIALIPGSSRSGVTIIGGLFLNLSRETAARFSFLLSLPAVFAAGIYQLYATWDSLTASSSDLVNLAAATFFAGIVGYASIAFLINYLKKHSTLLFIIYRIALGLGILGLIAAGYVQP